MRASVGEGTSSRLSMQLLDQEELDEVAGFQYTPRRGSRLPSNRPLSRRLVLILVCSTALILLGAFTLRDHVFLHHSQTKDLPSSPATSGDRQSEAIEKQRHRKAVVIASWADQDLRWLSELDSELTTGWEVFRYVGDGDSQSTDYIPLPSPDGREALAYLTYIVDNYDSLPDYSVFIHGHERAWHQPEHIIDKLASINLAALQKEEFFNLRCPTSPGCDEDNSHKFFYNGSHPEDHRAATFMADFWKDKLEDNFGPLPPVIGRRCCAQFAASRDAVWKQPKSFWQSLREPLIDDPAKPREAWREGMSGHRVALYYENVWHILLGKPADYCPSMEHCVRVHFQDKVHCDRDITSWEDRSGWESITCHNDMRDQTGPSLTRK